MPEMLQPLSIVVVPELDWVHAPQLKLECLRALAEGETLVELDCAKLTFLDSAGVEALVFLYRQFDEAKGNLSLINVSCEVARMLARVRLLDLLPVRSIVRAHSHELGDPVSPPLRSQTFRVLDVPHELSRMRHVIAHELSALDFAEDAVFDTTLAFGEALGNAFCHGCAENAIDDHVLVSITTYQDRVVIEVTDSGNGAFGAMGCEELMSRAQPQPEDERGRGILMMHMLVDSVRITKSVRGDGTCVTLVKLLRS